MRRPWARAAAARRALAALSAGATLRGAARAAHVHVATLCRWRSADPSLDRSFAHALAQGRAARSRRPRRRQRRPVYSSVCPDCGGALVVRRGGAGRFRFWACQRCPFASWRPRAPSDCPTCGGACFWSRSRLSVACRDCGRRKLADK